VDPWDATRDARRYAGPWPVVAHPPCARWSVLAYSVEARYPWLRVGEDFGTFLHALVAVRRWGGVLEHPARSLAFARYGLGKPSPGGWTLNRHGDWITQVSQTAYGHQAQKRTWLVFVGPRRPPALDWSEPAATHQVSYGKRPDGRYWLPPLTKARGNATPPAFRELLITLAKASAG